ncbi:MAG: hypothetical protein ACJ75S_09235 [Solirubrobacterales bacterium]
MSDRHQALAWEERWSLPAAVATLAAVGLLVASFLVVSSFGGGGEAASLREIQDHGSSVTLASLLQGLGFLLLAAPLLYLFQAALARSDRMRAQFRALVVVAPLALAVGSVLNGVAAKEAASDFTTGKSHTTLSVREAGKECRSERKEDAAGFRKEFSDGAAAVSHCATEKREDDEATNAIGDASLRKIAEGFQFGGSLALAFALVYSCLNALRIGLLTRFWGSLGIALGVAAGLGLFQFTLLWFVYFGLLVAGWVPGGRPPAWAAGEAIPWPTPGEKAAAELSPQANDELESPAEDPEDPAGKGQSQ